LPPFAEAHFLLGRMHVYVHLARRHLQEQHVGWMSPMMSTS
jgi:hypothetical protein